MAAVIVDITEAVKAELVAATLSQTYTVARVYMPSYDTATDTGCKLYVLGLAQAITSSTRKDDSFVYQVKVAIYKRVAGISDTAGLDAMVLFSEQVIDLFRQKKRLTAYPTAMLVSVVNDAVYDPDILNEKNVFAGYLTFEFELLR